VTNTTDTARLAQGQPLSALKLPELHQLASSLGIKGTSKMRKGDLVAAIGAARVAAKAASAASSKPAPAAGPPQTQAAAEPPAPASPPAEAGGDPATSRPEGSPSSTRTRVRRSAIVHPGGPPR
jgi:transcription termination factor Rho